MAQVAMIIIALLITLVTLVEGLKISSHVFNSYRLRTALNAKTLKYCEDVTQPCRRPTSTVTVGQVKIGSDYRVAKQTMATTITKDVEASVAQVLKIEKEGADLVRLTVQGRFEADACAKIKAALLAVGSNIPLVADIHFAPAVALRVADSFEKIRINPGNFADGIKSFEDKVYDSREAYDGDLPAIEKLLVPLIEKCKEKGRAMRIGTNHGSLSARVMSFWGDSPRGMVESAIEFAEICRKHDYHNFLFSMKASNPLVMVQAYRLLSHEMYNRGWSYPLHLGVTEAGEGEDGRMKSAIGIGALLADGLGDTVRVSLTEDPELELVPCATLVQLGEEYLQESGKYNMIPAWKETTASRDFMNFKKRKGDLPVQAESDGEMDIRGMLHRDGSVISTVFLEDLKNPDLLYRSLGAKMVVGMPFKDIATSDSVYLPQVPALDDKAGRKVLKRLQDVAVVMVAPIEELRKNPLEKSVAVVSLEELFNKGTVELPAGTSRFAVRMTGVEPDEMFKSLQSVEKLTDKITTIILETPNNISRIHAGRRTFQKLADLGIMLPVIHSLAHDEKVKTKDDLILRSGFEAGALLVDGLGDGIMLNHPSRALFPLKDLVTSSFGLLQGSRMRSTKTDFVSCPSCGRTLFDLQEVTEQIKEKTGHLPGVAIAIMGCIVNGPGEMADADFGYVGGAPGKVDLYVGRDVVKRAIPNALACDALVELIKENGRWIDKPLIDESVEDESVDELASA